MQFGLFLQGAPLACWAPRADGEILKGMGASILGGGWGGVGLQMLRPAPTPPPTVQTRINLRWESQATSSSGFSTVTRAIAMRALRDRKVNFMLSSSASGERNQEPEKYKDVYKAIMHKNRCVGRSLRCVVASEGRCSYQRRETIVYSFTVICNVS